MAIAPRDAAAITLEESVQLAVRTHPTVMAAVSVKHAADKVVDEARSEFFPHIDGRASTGFERSRTPGTIGRAANNIVLPTGRTPGKGTVDMMNTSSNITLRQMLFDGFETINRTRAARVRTKVANYQVHDAQELIALRAAQAYISVVRSREIVALAEENVQTHVEVLNDVRLRAQQGGGSIADVRQAETRLALAQTRLTELRGDMRDAETDFIEAVGITPEAMDQPEVPESALPASMEDAVEAALASNPAVLAAITTVDARRTDVTASKGVFWPRVDAELSAEANQNVQGSRGPERFMRAFAVARWNLFSGGGHLARTRRLAELAGEAVQLEAETKRLISEQMRTDFNAYRVAVDRLPTLEDRVLAADQVVVAYRQQFQLGQRTLLDVLDTENELFEARVALVTGESDVLDGSYRVLSTIGVLGTTLGMPAEEMMQAGEMKKSE